MVRQLAGWLRMVQCDQRGNVAVIFAAVLIPILGITASAIDFGRASKVKTLLAKASEAAVDAMAPRLEEDNDVLRTAVRTHLDANLPAHLRDIPFGMVIPSDRASINVTMDTSVKTTLMGLIGVPSLDVRIDSHARRPALPAEAPGAGPAAADAPPAAAIPAVEEVVRQLLGPDATPPPEIIRALEEQIREIERLAAEAGNGSVLPPPQLARRHHGRQRR